MAVLVGPEIGHQAAHQDTAEQRQGDAQHLRGGKSQYGAQTEISQNGCCQERCDVCVQYRRQGPPITDFYRFLVTESPGEFFLDPLEDDDIRVGSYSDGGRMLKGPGDGVSDDIPATIGGKQPARLADGEFVVPARIVSELGNGSTEAGARQLYAMMDRIQKARGKTTGKGKMAKDTQASKYLPA